MTGVVFPDQGAALQKHLKPGQRLVSARGDLWRWDGYAASADAPSPAAVRLSQRNRLTALEQETAAGQGSSRRRVSQIYVRRQGRRQRRARSRARRRRGRAPHRAEPDRRAGRSHPRRPRRRRTRLATGHPGSGNPPPGTIASKRREDAQADIAAGAGRTGRRRGADPAGRRSARPLPPMRAPPAAKPAPPWKASSAKAKAAAAVWPPSPKMRRAGRRAAIAAASQIAELSRRHEELNDRTRQLPKPCPRRWPTSATPCWTPSPLPKPPATRPPMPARRPKRVLAEADKHAKAADQALSAAREERARAQALSESAAARIEELRTRIRDELECAPEELSERAEIKDGEELPPLEQAEKRVEKLKQEREQLGGVNLRAEEEAAEQEAAPGHPDRRPRRSDRRHRAPAPRHPEPEQGRPRAAAGILRESEREFPGTVHQAVRRRRSQADLHRVRRPAGSRPGNLRPPAGQAAAVAGPAVGRRAGADRHGADLRRVPGQSGAGLRAGRSGRAAGRRQCRAFLQDAGPDDARCRAPASWSSPTMP